MQSKPDFGPKMMALPNDRWRNFVLALFEQSERNYTQAARMAGFQMEQAGLRVHGHKMAHDERVQEAILEETQRRMKAMLPLAQKVQEEIMVNPQAAPSDRLKAVQMSYDRAGLHAITETRHTQTIEGDPNVLKRIEALARGLGLPVEQLLGNRVAKLNPPTIEAEVTATTAGIEDLI